MHRPAPFMLLLLLWPSVAAIGDTSQTNALFQSMLLDYQEGRPITSGKALAPSIREEIGDASPDDIRQLFPLVRKCLESKSGALHSSAIMFLAAVALRPDGADRLDAFLEPLGAVFGDGADQDLKRGVISVIAASVPKPSPKGVAILAAHLNDSDNTGEERLRIGETLIQAFPNDSVILHKVIESFRMRPRDRFDAGRMMEALGLMKITAEEALSFLRDGLDDQSTRQAAIESIGRMPAEVRARFQTQLQQIAENPDELADTRSRARHVLLEQ